MGEIRSTSRDLVEGHGENEFDTGSRYTIENYSPMTLNVITGLCISQGPGPTFRCKKHDRSIIAIGK